MAQNEELLLKWGTVKGWENMTETSQGILHRYFEGSTSAGAIFDHPDEARRAILCELIDQLDGTIQNDWTGEMMSKDEAKKYVTEYGKRR